MATYKPLSTDFKDDILASQNSKRKYTQVNNSDGTVSFQDSTAYSQVGSSYGAKEVNEEREAINNIYANKLVTLNEIDLVTEPGFFVDAQVVKELNSKTSYNFESSAWTNPTYHITKKSGIVHIDYHCVVSGGASGVSFLVAKLPSAICPKNTIKSQAWTANGAGQRHGASIEIKPNGQIYLVAGDSFVEAGFTVSYPL